MNNLKFPEIEIYNGVTYDKLLQQIHSNYGKKDKQIQKLIDTLSKLIIDTSDASLVAPLISDYLHVAVKNDDQLIKLAAIIQKMIKPETNETGLGLSQTELKELEELADNMKSSAKIIKMG